MTPKLRSTMQRRSSQGSALLSAIALTTIFAAIAGGAAYSMTSWQELGMAKQNAQAAQALATAGVNGELNFVSIQSFANATVKSHTNQIVAGEPYAGNPGTLVGVPGRFWVYCSDPSNSSLPWSGTPTFAVTCVAEVGGVIASSKLTGGALHSTSIVGKISSLFTLYAAYAGMEGDASRNPSISLANGSVVNINNSVACNGIVSHPSATLSSGPQINGATTNPWNAGAQFPAAAAQNNPNHITLPKIPNILRFTFPQTAAMTDQQAWNWLKSNNNNGAILTYKKNLAAGSKISAQNVISAQIPATQTTLTNLPVSNNGDWKSANDIPGSSNTALIFPPGNYYLTSAQVAANVKTQIIIDNAGLSVGGNPTNKPVNIWFTGSAGQTDQLISPWTFTNPADQTTFRIYYGIDGSSLTVSSLVGAPTSSVTIPGALYGISGGSSGATISLVGGASATQSIAIQGSVMADRIKFAGCCNVVQTAGDGNATDYIGGVGYSSGYTG